MSTPTKTTAPPLKPNMSTPAIKTETSPTPIKTGPSPPAIKPETPTPADMSTAPNTPPAPPRLINPLTSLPIIHPAEAELLFHAAAIRYARIPHENLRRICADAGAAISQCDPVFGFETLLQVWMERLEREKKIWEEEKRAGRERDRREGAWGTTRVLWLDGQ